jgi:glycosyltransferase involved in cell wall biosynthesis
MMKDNHPVVSIIAPTYNHEKYISECIESAIAQTFEDWEMLVMNDGSTDRTAEIVESFAEIDQRIKLINQQNVGIFRLSETYNKALEIAKGEYIAILEGDDCWERQKLEKQVRIMESNPAVVVCWGQAESVNADKTTIYSLSPETNSSDSKYYNNDPIGSIMNIFLYRNCVPALTMLIRKDCLQQIGGFQQGFGLPLVDLPTLYELSLKGKFIFLLGTLGIWRNYASQITKTYPAEMAEGFYQMAKAFLEKHKTDLNFQIDLGKFNDFYTRRIIIAYARSGRYKLIRQEFNSARTDYLKAIFFNGLKEPLWKLRALTGLLFSFLHLNVEGLARLLGKKHYSKL